MIVVKKPEMREVAGHVPDNLVCVLTLLTSGKVLSMKCEVTGLSKAAEEQVRMQGGGIVIPCTYVLYGKKVNRADIKDELRKTSRKKKQSEDTGS